MKKAVFVLLAVFFLLSGFCLVLNIIPAAAADADKKYETFVSYEMALGDEKIELSSFPDFIRENLLSIEEDGVIERVKKKYRETIKKYADIYGLDERIIIAVIIIESRGDPNAESWAGAKGLMQLMDFTAREMGVRDSWDIDDNVMGGTKYLRIQLDRYKNFEKNFDLALTAYYMGPANLGKFLKRGGNPSKLKHVRCVKYILAQMPGPL